MSGAVEELLQKKGIPFSNSGKDILIHCLNPEHDDKNPSLRVDKISGVCHCYSCGFKTNIFKYFGILTVGTNVKVAKLKEKLKELRTDLFGIEPPKGLVDYAKSFRGISINTLRKFGACYTDLVPELQDRIIFPIKDLRQKNIVYVCRHTLSNANPRYINYPSGVKMPLYPAIPVSIDPSYLVLVEGLFDLLNLYDKGLTNVACCFGTNSIKGSIEEKLIPYKAAGLQKIFIMFDGDDPGRNSAEELKVILQKLDYTVEILPLEEGMDPGDLTVDDVEQIKQYINELCK